MKRTVLARRYAKALFELAQEKKILESVAAEVEAFRDILARSEELRHFLLSPEVGREGKARFLMERFQDRFSGLFVNFLMVLLRKRRQDLYEEIAQEFGRLHDRFDNRIRASAVTALPLGESELKKLREQLARQYRANFEIENRVDPQILGGLILQIDGKVIDASVRNQLEKLRSSLLIRRN